MREAATICPTPSKWTSDLLTLKMVSESRVTWPTSMPILVFLGLSVLNLGPMYATDRRQTSRQTSDAHHRLMPPLWGTVACALRLLVNKRQFGSVSCTPIYVGIKNSVMCFWHCRHVFLFINIYMWPRPRRFGLV